MNAPEPRHIVCTGGGSAGHVVPVIPIIQALTKRADRVSFIGSNSGLEAEVLKAEPCAYFAINTGKLRRYFSVENLVDAFRTLSGIVQTWRLLGRLKPDVVFSKGGFVAFPVVFAAWLRKIPVMAHESDYSPGLANRLSAPFIKSLCTNFPGASAGKFNGKVLVVGTPVRELLTSGSAQRGREILDFDSNRSVLLITGGSLGASVINNIVAASLLELVKFTNVVHVTGKGKLLSVQNDAYRGFEYVSDEWGHLLAAADLVVSRAGANTLYELLVLRKPNLLIPLSAKVSRGDQIENAEFAKKRGYSEVVFEQALTPIEFVSRIKAMLDKLDSATSKLEEFESLDSVGLIIEELDCLMAEI